MNSGNKTMIDQVMHKAFSLHQQGDLFNAEKLYAHVLQLDPKHGEANRLMGIIAAEGGDLNNAVQFLKKASLANPKLAMNHFVLGGLYKQLKEEDKAISAYKKSLVLKPDFTEAYNNLGLIFKNRKQFSDAINCFQNALKSAPDSAFTWSNLGNVLKESGQMVEAIEALKKACEVDGTFSAAYSNYLMALNYASNLSPEFVFKQHTMWHQFTPKSVAVSRFHFDKRTEHKKLRVAYISPDLHTHSVAYFIEPLFQAHDKSKIEVVAYYSNVIEDETTARLKDNVHLWRNIVDLSAEKVADQIYQDDIDILVDLAGHSANNSLPVFLQKPAPIQVTWLGYPNTSGLREIDYRLSDEIADPIGLADTIHSERLVRLPHGFLCYQGNSELPLSDSIPYDKKGYVTFGSFNNYVKVTPEVISVWAAILNSIPRSKLILKSSQFGDKDTRGRCIKLFKQHGVAKERLNLVAMLPNPSDHMGFYSELDIALDPFPYNGTTTTFEAMWMGVPTLTLKGEVHASRVGASILSRVGLNNYICDTKEAYIERAKSLVSDLEDLRILRSSLRSRMCDSDLCRPEQFARDIEAAYQAMWTEYSST